MAAAWRAAAWRAAAGAALLLARGSAAGRAPGRGSGVAAEDAEEEEEERRRAAGELLADFAQNAASSSSTSPPRSRTDLSDSPETKHSRLPPQPLAVPSPDGCNADGWPSHPGKRPLLSSSESVSAHQAPHIWPR